MSTQNKELRQGNSWNPQIAITEDDVAKNCIGFECMMIIKSSKDETATAVQTLSLAWISKSGGTGSFSLTPVLSKALSLATYYYEVFLYKTDGSFNRSIADGDLVILPTLEKDMPT